MAFLGGPLLGGLGGGAGRAERPEGAKVRGEGTSRRLRGHGKEAPNSPLPSVRPCETSTLLLMCLEAK